jgi:hypothetical protein
MKKDDARRAVLREYDRWAKKHPSNAKKMGGFVFFSYLKKEKPDLLDFRAVGMNRERPPTNGNRLGFEQTHCTWASPRS